MEMGRARGRLEAMLQAYVDKSMVAEEHRNKEHKAVLLLQSAWRRRMVYNRLRKWNSAATNIQRTYRGHLGREKHLLLTRVRDRALRMAYFNHKATVIQRSFRGYCSRRYVHSYYARKEFLRSAMSRGSDVKRELVENYKDQWTSKHRSAARKAKDDIDKFMEFSHYFLGTEHVKGIYYSHYLSVLGEPNQIEDKIRESRKQRNCVEDVKMLKRMKKAACPELWRYKYITSVGPYFTQYDVRMEAERKSKLLQYADEDFRTCFRDQTNVFKGRTLRLETEYGYEARKDRKGWKKISDQPFFVAVPRRRRFSCGGK